MFNPLPFAVDVLLARSAVRSGRRWLAFAPLAVLTVAVVAALLIRHA